MHSKNNRNLHIPFWVILIVLGAVLLFLLSILLILLLGPTEDMEVQEDAKTYIEYAGSQLPVLEDVPVNRYDASAFAQAENGTITYSGGYAAYGIDVSSHQEQIDWAAVAASGIDFAMIRVGYRGYTEGSLFMDDYFAANIAGAIENGIDVGVYFFSQAVSPEEAKQEADFVLEAIRAYSITYPVVYDWEYMHDSTARTQGIDPETVTQCALAFCETIQDAGYTPAVYFNNDVGYLTYDLSQISVYPLWLAEYDTHPDFYYDFQIWQYTDSGQVDGIETSVDMNIAFRAFS